MKDLVENYNDCLLYDGDCPFCSKFVTLLNLKKAIPNLKLINARENQFLYKELVKYNYDLNIGMILIHDHQLYYKDECVNKLSHLTERTNIFNNFISICFKNKFISKLLYPILRTGRRTWLFIRGIPLIK